MSPEEILIGIQNGLGGDIADYIEDNKDVFINAIEIYAEVVVNDYEKYIAEQLIVVDSILDSISNDKSTKIDIINFSNARVIIKYIKDQKGKYLLSQHLD